MATIDIDQAASSYAPPLTGGGNGHMTIRHAHPDDAPALMEMGRQFFREAGHEAQGLQFDDASFALTLGVLGRAELLLVVERFGKVIGMGAIDISCAYWNRSVKLAQELFWYLQPEHRVGRGGRVLRALERLAADKGASIFSAVAEEGDRAQALGRLYRSMGYELTETMYRKALRQASPDPAATAHSPGVAH
jgi:hypothetical protein